ncbi:MAG: M15 family metallopeptidase, partial [Candidatus Omnitrophota bacterium]
GTMNLLTFEELYRPLSEEQKRLLEAIRALDPKALEATAHSFGDTPSDFRFVALPAQEIRRSGIPVTLAKQFLPEEVALAYQEMMEAMKRDLGKVLYVESGYRAPAYQLYLFLRYLPKHGYSVRETNRFVALPGHSEHGAPQKQALDFISEEGVNGEDNPEEFEMLPEYQWLLQHAQAHGFVLSYPRQNPWGTTFEPWHWHYESRE